MANVTDLDEMVTIVSKMLHHRRFQELKSQIIYFVTLHSMGGLPSARMSNYLYFNCYRDR